MKMNKYFFDTVSLKMKCKLDEKLKNLIENENGKISLFLSAEIIFYLISLKV